MRSSLFKLALIVAAAALAAYTQLTHLTSVPGLHFDEAWQGLFAHRIATEPGFFPLSAMNSYTSPVVHFLLAAAFKAFGPSLAVMRGAYAAMNLLTLALIAGLMFWLGERMAVAWFVALWALLPLSVHDHRFYVEVTGFHGLCLAVTLWGLALWTRFPMLSFLLIALGMVAGTYSHILFVAVFAAGVFILARSFPAQFRTRRAQRAIAAVALLLAPLPFRMGLGLHKILPFALAGALFGTAAFALLAPRFERLERIWNRWPRRTMRLSKLVFILSLPFLVGFVGLLWNGPWPYAQATGHLDPYWVPINAAIFLAMLVLQLNRRHRLSPADGPDHREVRRERFSLSASATFGAFITSFLVTSILILKQSPRYYTVPLILGLIWCAQRLARLHGRKLQAMIAIAFVSYNLWVFHADYLARFERKGSTTREFKVAFYHDNGRDFRPFQKLWTWAGAHGCLAANPWVEDDRFKLPFDFLRLTAQFDPAVRCPWNTADLFFSHIENYDPSIPDSARNDTNTPPPPPAPNVKYLAHFPEWGDLAVWIRR